MRTLASHHNVMAVILRISLSTCGEISLIWNTVLNLRRSNASEQAQARINVESRFPSMGISGQRKPRIMESRRYLRYISS